MAKAGIFDITEKVIDYAYRNIKDMPGNPGQQVLVERLVQQMSNGQILLDAEIDQEFQASPRGELDFSSEHPDAIDQIINEAILRAEELAEQATIPGPPGWSFDEALSTGNWKIVGYDQ